MCIDLDLPSRAERLITDSIRQQIAEFRFNLANPPPQLSSSAAARECLVSIKLDLTVNNVLLRDQFEWDMANPDNVPEPFARALCLDLGLSREFEAAIAHTIREQIAV